MSVHDALPRWRRQRAQVVDLTHAEDEHGADHHTDGDAARHEHLGEALDLPRRGEPGQEADEDRRAAEQSRGARVHPPLVGSLDRSEEHTSELQSLMRISYAVFCLKKKTQTTKK